MAIKQPLYLNGKIFNSMNKAAKFLRISVSALADKLKNKEATVYKDILIEKAKIEPKPQPKLLKRKGIPVIVDGVMYNSCKDAERIIGCGTGSLADAIRRRGKTTFFGHQVEPLYPSMVGKIKRRTQDAVKVLCKTTGITYNTITEASKVAEADDWTMSKKMETEGSFFDKNGNEYIRLKPMKTKNTYKKTHNTARFYSNRCEELTKVNSDNVKPVEPVEEKKDAVPQIVKDAINEKIILMLKEKGLYEDIVNLLNYGGFSTIKITD
jgi:hypothetical protein